MKKGKTWYRCDPKKNCGCRKRMCIEHGGPCRRTSEAEYAEKDADGNVVSGYPDFNNHSIDATRYALEPVSRRMGVIA